jgi:acyl-CoA thioester hydrolase
MQVYSESRRVRSADLDEMLHVNNIRYIVWIQEISKAHWLSRADAKLQALGVWVVREHKITYYKSAKLNDDLLLTTWVLEMKGPISTRIVEIKNNKTGDLLVKAVTDWCFLDPNTLRPKRIPEKVEKRFQ